MSEHKTWDERMWTLERLCLKLGTLADSSLTEEHRFGWLRCLRSRKVILVENADLPDIEQEILGGKTKVPTTFNFKNLPFEEFTIMINAEKVEFIWMSIFPKDDDPDNKLAVVGVFMPDADVKASSVGFTPIMMDYSRKGFRSESINIQEHVAQLQLLAESHGFAVIQYCLNQLTETRDVEDRPHKPLLRKQKQGKWEVFHKVVDWTAGCHGKKSEDRHTGAKKCFHTRRGHYRRLASGKEVWVRETTSGSVLKGIVTKTYRVTANKK